MLPMSIAQGRSLLASVTNNTGFLFQNELNISLDDKMGMEFAKIKVNLKY